MKNISKILALFGIVAMLFAMIGCASNSGEDADPVAVVEGPKDYNEYWNPSTTTGEGDAPVDYFSVWADLNWCGSRVSLYDMNATENSATLSQTVTGSCWFGTQIWYVLDVPSSISFKVTSTVAGDITINGEVYTLEADIPLEINLEEVEEKIAMQLGRESTKSQLGDCTFSITDFVVTPLF